MLLIGFVLDGVDAIRVANGGVSALYSLDSFRIAFIVPFLIAIVGTVGLLITRRRTRRRMFEEEGIVVAPIWVALFGARGQKRG